MTRPCFLVVDREFSSMISTRKLVIETAKFNVITAYSGEEALETLRKFPAIDGIVLDAHMRDIPADQLIVGFRSISQNIPVIAVHTPGAAPCANADLHVESLAPEKLLETIRSLHPEYSETSHRRNQDLRLNENS